MRIRMAALSLILSAIAVSARAEPITLRFGQIPSAVHGLSSLVPFVAQSQGFFAKEGVVIEPVQIPGGTGNMVAALERGFVDVTQTATPYLIQSVLNGSHAVAIASEVGTPIYSLVAKPNIGNFADLKGKTIALSLPVDTISYSTRELLRDHGLGEGDYQVKELVGSPARAACLKSGECDAVALGQPDDFLAVKDGFRRLGDTRDAVTSFVFDVVAVRRDFAEQHLPAMIGLTNALADACNFIRDPENRDEVAKSIVALTGISNDIARAILDLYFNPDRGTIPPFARIADSELSQVIDFMIASGAIKEPYPDLAPDRFMDMHYFTAKIPNPGFPPRAEPIRQ